MKLQATGAPMAGVPGDGGPFYGKSPRRHPVMDQAVAPEEEMNDAVEAEPCETDHTKSSKKKSKKKKKKTEDESGSAESGEVKPDGAGSAVEGSVGVGDANDDDGEKNGNIVDPGGVAVIIDNNNLPVAVDDSLTLSINESVTIDVLANDTDLDGDALTITSAHVDFGSVEIVNNQLFYQSSPAYGGLVTINYGIADENGATDHAIVIINYIANTAPVAVDDYSQIEQGQVAQLNLLANDSDIDGDSITLISTDNGQVTINQDGQAVYTPGPDLFGDVVISYTITDSVGQVASAVWRVNIIQITQLSESTTTGGGPISFISLMLLMLCASRRKITS